MKFSYTVLLLVFGLNACIDPFSIATEDLGRIITVDGLISTAPGPHEVRITVANQFTNTSEGNRIMLTNAKVFILENEETRIDLEELILTNRWFCTSQYGPPFWRTVLAQLGRETFLPTGKYYTPADFCAKVGSTYTLHIVSLDGRKYVSQPETVRPVATIDKVEVQPYNTATINPLIATKGIELIANFTDPPEEGNHYFWKLSDAYITLITEPYLARINPAPCCETCFIPDLNISRAFSVTDDFSFNGLSTRQLAVRISDDGIRFKRRYRVRLNQYAISPEAYRFLRLVRQQLDIQGSVFDPPPANIRGNMMEEGNPEQQVLGYFFAVDVSSQMVYVNRGDFPSSNWAVQAIVPFDCRDYCGMLQEPPTLDPPDDWEWN